MVEQHVLQELDWPGTQGSKRRTDIVSQIIGEERNRGRPPELYPIEPHELAGTRRWLDHLAAPIDSDERAYLGGKYYRKGNEVLLYGAL